jgi:hypothetical protein
MSLYFIERDSVLSHTSHLLDIHQSFSYTNLSDSMESKVRGVWFHFESGIYPYKGFKELNNLNNQLGTKDSMYGCINSVWGLGNRIFLDYEYCKDYSKINKAFQAELALYFRVSNEPSDKPLDREIIGSMIENITLGNKKGFFFYVTVCIFVPESYLISNQIYLKSVSLSAHSLCQHALKCQHNIGYKKANIVDRANLPNNIAKRSKIKSKYICLETAELLLSYINHDKLLLRHEILKQLDGPVFRKIKELPDSVTLDIIKATLINSYCTMIRQLNFGDNSYGNW